jgi:hypothetical protein
MKPALACRQAGTAGLLFGVLFCGPAYGEAVHKCVVDGKTTYQAEECKGDDKVLKISADPGPDKGSDHKGRHAGAKGGGGKQGGGDGPRHRHNQGNGQGKGGGGAAAEAKAGPS